MKQHVDMQNRVISSNPFHSITVTPSLLRSRYQGRHATLLPHGEKRCVTTLITANNNITVTPSLLRSRYQGRHATLLPHGEKRCVTTLITAAEETKLHPALEWNYRCSSQWRTFRRSFPVNVFISERFVSHFIVLSLNERDVLNKQQQQDSTFDICMQNFTGVVNYCGEKFCRNFSGGSRRKKIAKSQKLDPAEIQYHKLVNFCFVLPY